MKERIVATGLEARRFKPTPESSRLFKQFRKELKDAQKEMPEVRGLGFFGSRTIGQENASDTPNPSDLDLIVFYDGESPLARELDPSERRLRGIGYDPHKKYIQSYFSKRMQDLNLPVDKDVHRTIGAIDISPNETTSKLRLLNREFDDYVKKGILKPWEAPEWDEEHFMGVGYNSSIQEPVLWSLASRFFLVIGEDVYRSRKFILDSLAETEDGEKYFTLLMNFLQYTEREKATEKRPNTPSYEGYPKNIKEARSYFLRAE